MNLIETYTNSHLDREKPIFEALERASAGSSNALPSSDNVLKEMRMVIYNMIN